MNKKAFAVVALVVALAAGARAASDTIVGSFPAPSNFIFGMACDGTTLYAADGGPTTRTVYRLNPTSGAILGSYNVTGSGGISGLACNAGYLWVGTFGTGTNLYRCIPSTGSVVNSYAVPSVLGGGGIAADDTYIYVSNNYDADPKVYRVNQTTGSVTASWTSFAKYPMGLERITHVPTSTQVLLNCGNVDGWVYVYDLNGTRRAGEEFKLNVPQSPNRYTGDLATLDDTHIFYADEEYDLIYQLLINWNSQEYPGVTPASLGRVKALYR